VNIKKAHAQMTPRSGVFRSIGYVLLGSMLITFSDALIKWLGSSYPAGQMLCTRSAFFLLMVAAFVLCKRDRTALRVRNIRAHVLRGALATGSAFLFVASLRFLPLADTITIAFAAPLFLTAMAPYFLSEHVGWRRWSAVMVGFCGVLIMMKPGSDAIRWVALLPVAAAVLEAARDVLTRRMTVTESTLAMVTVTTAVIVVLSAMTSVTGWPPMTWGDAGLLAVGGALFGGAHLCLAEALRLAKAVVVAPFRYSPVVWALLLGYILWGDVPDTAMLSGTALVVASGLYIFHREATIRSNQESPH